MGASEQDSGLKRALLGGTKSSPELQQRLSISQSALSRAITRNKQNIVVLGAARSTRYGLLKTTVPGLPTEIPIFKVEQNGDVTHYGHLYVLAGEEYGFLPKQKEKTVKHYTYLPYEIQNMWPEGFMGRSLAHHFAAELGVPKDLGSWTAEHALLALSKRGEDVTGNLIVGKESLDRYFRSTRKPQDVIEEEGKLEAFRALGQQAIAGEPAGSSAGGEQPKFTAITRYGGEPSRVIIKFAMKTTEEGRRWSDLLICEELALTVLSENNFACAPTKAYQDDCWTFLESVRFDRKGLWGRLPMVSMKTIDSEFVGCGDSWTACAEELSSLGLMSRDDSRHIQIVEGFGSLIANTDMHLGNFSFFPHGERFIPAPIYDMTPMYYKPRTGGILPDKEIGHDLHGHALALSQTLEMAEDFWARASEDPRITPSFRAICAKNCSIIEEQQEFPGMRR